MQRDTGYVQHIVFAYVMTMGACWGQKSMEIAQNILCVVQYIWHKVNSKKMCGLKLYGLYNAFAPFDAFMRIDT